MGESNQIKTILVSQLALPYHITGSWTNMYNTILKSGNHHFDFIICPEPKTKAKNVCYVTVNGNDKGKLVKKIIKKSNAHKEYITAIKEIIQPDGKYIIQIVDNSGLTVALSKTIKKHFDRHNFYIQYYYHGFLPIENTSKAKSLFKAANEIIFITAESYKAFMVAYDELTFRARVIHNGIDLSKFKPIDENEKHALRASYNIDKDAFVFVWCSHSRPKKGLHIAIDAFKKLQETSSVKVELLVIGVNHSINYAGITNVGHIPNDDIVKYYQMADVFLFPSLWQEGFGIVLAEALHCGCYVIASNRGGIKEVLANGDYGVLIDKPNIVSEWVNAMHIAIKTCAANGNPFKAKIPKDIYSLQNWSDKLNTSILEAKEQLK